MLETITIEPPEKSAKYCVIWLHGLGADGHDFEGVIPDLGLPDTHNIRFVFPHAPYRSITINKRMEMRAWYDIYTLDSLDHEDAEGIEDSIQSIDDIIQQQDLPTESILLAGFSQGGAIALYMGITAENPYAGIIALSTYLPFLHTPNKRPPIKQATTPILQCHGHYDDIIPIALGKETHDYLKTKNHATEWHEYAIGHHVCNDEIKQIGKWLRKQCQEIS